MRLFTVKKKLLSILLVFSFIPIPLYAKDNIITSRPQMIKEIYQEKNYTLTFDPIISEKLNNSITIANNLEYNGYISNLPYSEQGLWSKSENQYKIYATKKEEDMISDAYDDFLEKFKRNKTKETVFATANWLKKNVKYDYSLLKDGLINRQYHYGQTLKNIINTKRSVCGGIVDMVHRTLLKCNIPSYKILTTAYDKNNPNNRDKKLHVILAYYDKETKTWYYADPTEYLITRNGFEKTMRQTEFKNLYPKNAKDMILPESDFSNKEKEELIDIISKG